VMELVRVPSKKHQAQVQRQLEDPSYVPYRFGKYDYRTADGRWYIEQYGGCGGGWAVIDTTGEYVCASCRYNSDGHATIRRTLSAAKAFIVEWAI
jgi:hypothetical protein